MHAMKLHKARFIVHGVQYTYHFTDEFIDCCDTILIDMLKVCGINSSPAETSAMNNYNKVSGKLVQSEHQR